MARVPSGNHLVLTSAVKKFVTLMTTETDQGLLMELNEKIGALISSLQRSPAGGS